MVKVMNNLLETNPIGVAVFRQATVERVFVNLSFARLFGANTTDPLISQKEEQSWVSQDRFREFKEQIISGKGVTNFEAERRRLDGSTVWLQMNSQMIDFDGQTAYAVWHIDISETLEARLLVKRSNAEMERQIEDRTRELEYNNEKLKVLSEAASDWFWEMGPDLKYRYISDRIAEIGGIPTDYYIGKTRAELANEDTTSEKWQSHFKDLENHRPFRDFRYERVAESGKLQYLSASGMPRFDEAGVFTGYIGIGTDLTLQKHAEDEVELANARLAAAIDAFSEPFALWDAQDRLFLGNKTFWEINKSLDDKLKPGISYQEFAEALAYCGLVADAVGREDEWIAERVARHAHPTTAFEQERNKGHWLMIYEQRFSDGSIVTISTDITRLKKAEALLKESQQRFRDFADVAADWYWEQDSDYRFIDISNDNQNVLGTDTDSVIGKCRWDIQPIEVCERDMAAHRKTVEAHQPFSDFRFARYGADNKLLYMSVSGKPTYNDDGEFTGYRGAGRNITEIVEAQRLITEERDRAEKANRSKSHFLANMSHELRTPLNSIIGYSQMIKGEFLGPINVPKYLEYAEDIYMSGQHLLMVISDILDISKVEAGEVNIEESDVHIAEVVESALMIVELIGKTKDQQIRTHVAVNFPCLRVDVRLIRQILINLLSNAIKFTPHGGVIEISAHDKAPEGIEISVKDSGIGIAAEDYETAFEPFGQIRSSPEHTHEGTGLGLAISKQLMELHGGDIRIESALGKGTTISLAFPRERVVPYNKDQAQEEPANAI